jgi:integrase
MKPVGWPRYMIEKRLSTGATAYYWNPPNRDIAAGFTLGREALGPDYGAAVERARILNANLDPWREAHGVEKIDEAQPGYATLGWLFNQYRRHHLFQKKVSERTKGGYERAMRAIEDVPTKLGYPAARLPLTSITPAAVDKFYEKLLKGPRKADRVTVAGYCIDVARRAWSVVQRKHPTVVPPGNPWAKVERVDRKRRIKPAATREEVYALSYALKELGEPHLGAAALICFEWHLRPENVLTGAITWSDYNPPDYVLIRHGKNDTDVPLPLCDDQGPFYPEIDAYLAELPRLGLPIVLTGGKRGPARPYAMVYAQRRVREARVHADLGPHVTLDACRHGGLTEAADAGATEQQIRARSGHKTVGALRVYLKRTDTQRMASSRLRRAHVEGNKTGAVVRIGRQIRSQNGTPNAS